MRCGSQGAWCRWGPRASAEWGPPILPPLHSSQAGFQKESGLKLWVRRFFCIIESEGRILLDHFSVLASEKSSQYQSQPLVGMHYEHKGAFPVLDWFTLELCEQSRWQGVV